jgi:putative tryptophan/tyrosine transport system substrate-binding protein
MRRREFIMVLGSAPVFTRAARAQKSAMPVIGFLSSRTASEGRYLVAAIRRGLLEAGYIEGQNAAIEYRWGDGRIDRLPALAADLLNHEVAVIIAGGTSQPAKAATATIPIVFTTGLDPIEYGLVSSLNQPGGNITGITFYSGALGAKQLELLREMAPDTSAFALLVKLDNPSAEPQIREAQKAARATGHQIQVLTVRSDSEFENAFATASKLRNGALLVAVDPYFDSRASQLTELAARYRVPTIYNLREFVVAGGLMSYGASITDAYHQAGVYAGRILKGAKPAELPVQLPTRFELVINLKSAKALGLAIPPTLLARADEVIE